jgi:cytochrome P450 monooxygenase
MFLADHAKPHGAGLGDYAWRVLGRCVGQQSGEKWRIMRSHFDPEFSNQAARRSEPFFRKCIQDWLEWLAPKPPGGSFVRDTLASSRVLAFRVLAEMYYGEALDDAVSLKSSIPDRRRRYHMEPPG